jgi:hypothetical protein
MREDLKNIEIIHNLDFEWGTVIEGKIYGVDFKVSVDFEGVPFDVRTSFNEQKLIGLLDYMGLTNLGDKVLQCKYPRRHIRLK